MEQNQFRTKSVEELSEFFHNLFFLDVSVKRGGVFDIQSMPSFVVSVYRNKNDAIIGALLLDIPAAACLAGALCDLPEDIITGIIASDSFTEDIWGDLQEVLNICSQLFTSYDGDAITLEEVYLHPSSLPQEAFDVLANDFNPLLFRLAIDGYGGGVMGVLDAENNSIFADMASEPVEADEPQFTTEAELSQAAPNLQNDFLADDDEDHNDDVMLQGPPVVQQVSQTASSPIPTLSFGLAIGALIGGLVVKAFFTPEAQIIEVPSQGVHSSVGTPPTAQLQQKAQPFKNVNDIEQVLVPSGAFHMGCTTEYASECIADEFPSHSVKITNSFYMMKHEATQDLYRQVMNVSPSQFNTCTGDCPVENISWIQAVTFANRLSEYEGLEKCYTIAGLNVTWDKGVDCLGWRLPTEAEWEYAARGKAGQSEGRFSKSQNQSVSDRSNDNTWVYAGSNTPSTVAWYGGFKKVSQDKLGRKVGEGAGRTRTICTKQPNDLGLCDMSGNVWEWVWDGYGPYSKRRLSVDPTGNAQNAQKVLRGGSWLSSADELRTSYRMYATRTVIDTMVSSYGSFGVRLVRTSPAVKSMP